MTTLEALQLAALIVALVISPAAAAGGAYAAVKAHLRSLQRQCDELRGDVNRAHARIDAIATSGRI